MDDNDNGSEPIEVEFNDVSEDDSVLEEMTNNETVTYELAKWVMEEAKPGFVLIGSPIMAISPNGMPYPDSIGIVVNDKIGLTKTGLANILLEIAAQLGEDMAKLEAFVKDALNDH